MTQRYMTVGRAQFSFEFLEIFGRWDVIAGNNYERHDEDESRRSLWRRMLGRRHMGGRGREGVSVTHRVIKREAPTSRKRKLRRMRQREEVVPRDWEEEKEENIGEGGGGGGVAGGQVQASRSMAGRKLAV